MGRRRSGSRRLQTALAAIGIWLLVPAIVSAHPLGNFTINHYAGIRVEPDRVLLDVVIDQAEVPAFQARLDFDADDDGSVSDDEVAAGRLVACLELADDLLLTAGGRPLDLRLASAGLSFPLGTSGLSTLRLACGFDAALQPPIASDPSTRLTFSDSSFADRLGWREIVAVGSGTTISIVGGDARPATTSERLTAYPADLVAQPLDDRDAILEVVAGGAELAPWAFGDATPVTGSTAPSPPVAGSARPAPPAATSQPAAVASTSPVGGAVPGGIEGSLPTIFASTDITPVVLLLALLTAAALGAGHALTPGHGKTLMAAYLVGTRGTPLHALGLGLSVSLSHTIGILVLAGVVVGAADLLPPDVVVRGAPVVAAISIVAIGAWMLAGEIRRRRAAADASLADHHHPGEHVHHADHDHLGEHSHGGARHSHVPASGSTISWRSLFVLGLAGGLIPSTSALLILLGSIAAGRQGFGIVLVIAFGLGMAGVMTAIGLAVVFARGRLDGLPDSNGLGRIREVVPLAAAVLVFGFGVYLTAQALGGVVAL